MDYIPIGPVVTMLQNVAYALPARQVRLIASVQLSTSIDNSTYTANAATTTGTDVSGAFVKCTTGNALVVCRA